MDNEEIKKENTEIAEEIEELSQPHNRDNPDADYKYPKPIRTGAWMRVSKKGNPYIGGKLGDHWFRIFKNQYYKFNQTLPYAKLYIVVDDKELIVNLYKRTSKKGVPYLAGRYIKSFALFENTNKKSENAPDYHLCISPIEKKQELDQNKVQAVQSEHEQGFEIEEPSLEDDEIPF